MTADTILSICLTKLLEKSLEMNQNDNERKFTKVLAKSFISR